LKPLIIYFNIVLYNRSKGGGGPKGHRGTKSRSNCERTYRLRVVIFLIKDIDIIIQPL